MPVNILDFLFPKSCFGCGEWGEYLCSGCLNKIKVNNARICPVCRRPAVGGKTHPGCQTKHNLDGLTPVFTYSGLLQKIIKKMKYKFIYDVYQVLVELLLTCLGEDLVFDWVINKKPILVSVPLHKARQRWRGFNQSEILGKEIAKNLGINFSSSLLARIKNTNTQSLLSKKQREGNIKGAFSINPKYSKLLNYPNFLLFDDVWTTGATMRECAKVLKKSGAKFVWGLTLAAVV
jgi:competence protein ComFC